MAAELKNLIEYWCNHVERDLTPFIDPGTKLQVERSGRSISAQWQQRGQPRDVTFQVSLESGIQTSLAGRTLTYRSFLASAEMADLLGLAKMTLQSSREAIFVETKALRGDSSNLEPRPATQVLLQALDESGLEEETLVVMVTGEAGAGKTSVLQELVKQRANQYLRGKTDSLLLYVNAQGRALARFNEALATELQDLRSLLTYHAVSVLVRNGLLIPVIDGFDELLGVGGYDDAFSSLASFIEDLDGKGKLVASARSAYYEQEFVSRANRVSSLGAQVWRQIPIEVRAWDENELAAYIDKRAHIGELSKEDTQDLHARVKAVFRGPNKPLAEKPFFVARTVDLLMDGVQLGEEEDLLDAMVRAYLIRERSEKLLDRFGGSLISLEQLRMLLVNLAEEMWNQETRELDRISVREVAEYVLITEDLSEAAQRTIIERMPTLAFLRPGERSGGVTFEHETFFAFFLADRFAEVLSEEKVSATPLLSRSVLPTEVASRVVTLLHKTDGSIPINNVLGRLGNAGGIFGPRMEQVRENAGLLAAFLLRDQCVGDGCERIKIENLVVPGNSLEGVTLKGAILDDVEFRRTNLCGTRFLGCSARAVIFIEVLVDPETTRLEIEGLDVASQVLGLRALDHDGGVQTLFDPGEVHNVLVKTGACTPIAGSRTPFREISEAERKLFERFVRAYSRTNLVCTSDDNLTSLFHHPSWPRIERLLVESQVVSSEKRQAGGPAKTFLRRQVLVEELVAGIRRDALVPKSVKQFWDSFERSFPASDANH